MSPSLLFFFALLAAIAQIATIFNYLRIDPRQIFKRDWWISHEVTVSKGRLVLILGLAFVSLALSSYGFYTTYKQTPMPRILQWGVGNKHCNVVVDTSGLAEFKENYDVVLACGIVDPTIDAEKDTRIILSGPFGIQLGPQAISAASNPEFDKLVEPSPGVVAQIGFWQRVFLIPKDRNVTEIHKLSDVRQVKGKLF